MKEKEKKPKFTWQVCDGGTSTITEVTPRCDICPYNPFKDEPDSEYTQNDGEPV